MQLDSVLLFLAVIAQLREAAIAQLSEAAIAQLREAAIAQLKEAAISCNVASVSHQLSTFCASGLNAVTLC